MQENAVVRIFFVILHPQKKEDDGKVEKKLASGGIGRRAVGLSSGDGTDVVYRGQPGTADLSRLAGEHCPPDV